MKGFELVEQPPAQAEIAESEITPEAWQAALQYCREHEQDLIRAASFSRDKAVSHREPPFEVGCAVVGIEPNTEPGEYAIYQAYNFKPRPGPVEGARKRCAERNALDAARGWAVVVPAIVTVSKETTTGDETKGHDVLHPCGECRKMYQELLAAGFLREDTMMSSANDAGERPVVERRALKELLELYGDGRGAAEDRKE